MRNWRVGSITLGFTLLVFGISMLMSRITGFYTLLDVVLWWPVVLILLGIEILASLFLSKEKPSRVNFDGGSIFLITLLVVFALGVSVISHIAVSVLPEYMDTDISTEIIRRFFY